MAKESKKYKLNTLDWSKIIKGLWIAIGGTLIPYIIEVISVIDFGKYQYIANIVSMVLVNVVLKLVKGK